MWAMAARQTCLSSAAALGFDVNLHFLQYAHFKTSYNWIAVVSTSNIADTPWAQYGMKPISLCFHPGETSAPSQSKATRDSLLGPTDAQAASICVGEAIVCSVVNSPISAYQSNQ